MSVTFHPAAIAANPANYPIASHVEELVPQSIQGNKSLGEIFQSSFSSGPSAWERSPNGTVIDLSRVQVSSNQNGFVNAAVNAYNNHNHLVIAPDDVWIAILLQFNLFVNANAEELRHVFVQHEGKKELTVRAGGTRHTVDFGSLAEQMTLLIQKNVLDPDLRTWIVPEFSTTTPNDRIVSSVVMMATLKAYFSYTFSLLCGLPQVTLLGQKGDWEKLLVQIDKLKSYGKETTQWHALLKPVLTRFVYAFDDPHSAGNKNFWQEIAHRKGGGSGPRYLSGWITAFCFFDKEGQSLYAKYVESASETTDAQQHFAYPAKDTMLRLDDAAYHMVNTNDIPPGFAEVDVKLDDNGRVINSVMIAGQLGIKVSSSGIKTSEQAGKDDIVQPVSGWLLAEKVTAPQGMKELATKVYKEGQAVLSRFLIGAKMMAQGAVT